MSDSILYHTTKGSCSVLEMNAEGSKGTGAASERRGPDCGCITMLDRTKEFFQTCDMEGKGYITRTDMRRLHRELPFSAEELENVFDSLVTSPNAYLTQGEFSSGLSQFLHGRRISLANDTVPVEVRRVPEALYQSQWEQKLTGGEDEEEKHFSMLMESLGASNVFEDPGEVRSLWAQLRRDEPHLLSNFEEFLSRVTSQIKEAHHEKREMESALQRKAATHDSEIRRLYEEMEAQIKNEKEKLFHGDSERLHSRSQDLEHQLSSKEKELEQLFQKQRRLERQCRELSSEQQESRVENVKLKMTNEDLCRELESTCQELSLAQEQLGLLQEQAARLHQEKEMEMYRVTEGLQREKQSLMKQLDLLREMNKHLKDERDICYGVPRTSLRKKQKQRAGLGDLFADTNQPSKRDPLGEFSYQSLEALPVEHLHIVFVASSPSSSSSCSEDEISTTNAPVCQQLSSPTRNFGLANGYPNPALASTHLADGKEAEVKRGSAKMERMLTNRAAEGAREKEVEREVEKKTESETEGLDAPPDGWPLRRVISIEEDHLPHLLLGGQPLLHQLSEEDEDEDDDKEDNDEEEESDLETSVIMATHSPAPPIVPPVNSVVAPSHRMSRFSKIKKAPMSARGQPVGKETQHKVREGVVHIPERLFKVVLVGNSSVGKTSLLRSFCEGRFHPTTSATVGEN
ncbi:EF-hand calcium-binding domain-containing protein 4B-like [Aplochiton taeniatus]